MYEKSADSTCTFQRQRLIFQSYFENNFDHIYTHADKYLLSPGKQENSQNCKDYLGDVCITLSQVHYF
jgi:hypothetical protein